ncbi:MAG: NAD-dependent epimerase/dehydratase family protein [Betaproteobacteria bacterium]|nr:NAD-dependent epimerase/dehydratase family protein [Betaproteobacteria bacterium]
MNVFITGASGYIGGSIAARLIELGHEVLGLVRTEQRAREIAAPGLEPVVGDLSDSSVLVHAVRRADAVINAANSDHRPSVDAMLDTMRGSGKTFIQSSGTSIVADLADGEHAGPVHDETTPVHPLPLRAGRVALNDSVLAASGHGIRGIVVCPSLIYGEGHGLHRDSIQIPWLMDLARKHKAGRHVGPGRNVWSNVHIDDLVDMYVAVLQHAPTGALYYAENGENSMLEAAAAVSRALGFGGITQAMTVDEAVAVWGEGPARYTMGSNSRVRAVRARRELGWLPVRPSLLQYIESTGSVP